MLYEKKQISPRLIEKNIKNVIFVVNCDKLLLMCLNIWQGCRII